MCDRCAELDSKIEHYRLMAQWVNDKKNPGRDSRLDPQVSGGQEDVSPRTC
jgi:hypothetical protein